jgi:ABC-type glycerol-3-phosphate transport system substrate-binding protein
MKTKGVLAALVVLLVFVSFSWAGGNKESPKATQATGTFSWQQAKGSNITVAMNLGAESDFIGKALPKFEAQTGIKVDYQPFPELELHEKTLVAFTSKAGLYDVVMQDFMFTPQYAKAGFTLPLDDYINNPSMTDKAWFAPDDFLKGLWSAMQYDGKTMAIPLTGETTLLQYREDLFKEKGLKVPTTFDELWAAAKALNNPPEIYGIGLRGQRGQGMNIFTWTQFFRGFGGKFFKDFPSDMTPTVNSPEAVKATQFYADILKNYGPPGVANWTNMDMYAAQQQGKIAMTMDANAFGPIIDDPEKSKTAGKWRYAVVPGGPGGPAPAIYTHCLSLAADSKSKTAAWLFISWATGPEMTKERGFATGVPTRASTWTDPEYVEKLKSVGDGTYTTATAQSMKIADGQYRPIFPHWREMGDILGIAVQSVIAGSDTSQAAMDRAQKDITAMLVNNGYLKQ